jgi:hypothetical protein
LRHLNQPNHPFVLSAWSNLQKMLNCLHIICEVGVVVFDEHLLSGQRLFGAEDSDVYITA